MQSTTHSTHDHSTVVDETSGSAAAAATNGDSLSTRCDCCKSCGAILELDGCGHRFHPRCIYSYPITQCELCSTAVTTVKIFRPFKNSTNTMERKGKWSVDEHKYANMMMKQFKNGAMPLVDGLHLRGFIANLLQCDPLRVTKKYAGQAIGKQNFYYQRNKSYCYNVHTKLQKRVSDLRNHFYWHIQYRCKFGYAINIQELKTAEADYWIREFNKFANKIGQRVEFAAPSTTVAPASPLSSPSPSLSQSSVASIRPSTTTPSDEASTTVVVVPAVMAPPPSTPTEQQPASRPHVDVAHAEKTYAVDLTMPFKQLIEQAVSPISFDEWRENGTPSLDVFDKVQLEDLTKQYSDQLTEIFNPLADAAGQSDKLTSRCGMREWILDEEKGWNDSLSGTSWSFSIPLSDA